MAVGAHRQDAHGPQDEWPDRERYPHIVTREYPAGREAYVLGTGLRVWELVSAGRSLGQDASAIADHFIIPRALVDEALAYAEEHREEVQEIIRDNDSYTFERLREALPSLELYEVDIEAGCD